MHWVLFELRGNDGLCEMNCSEKLVTISYKGIYAVFKQNAILYHVMVLSNMDVA